MAIEALLERDLLEEIVDTELLLLFDHAVDLDRPGPKLQRLRGAGNVLGRTELVEIVVVGVDFLVGDGSIEDVFFVAFSRIKILAWIGQIGNALRQRQFRRERDYRSAGRGHEGTTAEK